ncbi:pyridine nucleotide disulfide oxidoreductase-like protein [Rhizopogon vinicolor AM-OR11-026]|uniref:L-2-hydroxyglutarate dehydrogenase, mitochondrial n=1 Tax=Rhizopogon vinicolor AM-OR11-026 TaxID=1314800 RepID=A0A1B7N2I7_9AGAM|nr:pyridine nucleotide disulfide oxidoreductase-like protein [Rhizopogon vinicolor AM-OR11-026]
MAATKVRGFAAALNATGQFKYKTPDAAVDFLVVGGGVVGLAVAQKLSERFPTKSTYLVERHPHAGEETSSRNSEVIHAGLYYPPGSLKTQLCLRGRHLMYERCNKLNIPYRKTGKLVVAHEHQRTYVESLFEKARQLPWPKHSPPHRAEEKVLPVTLISGAQARELEPDLSPDIAAALWSPETGIVDSHSFMESLEKDISESEGGELVFSTRVVRVDPYKDEGWVVQTVTENAEQGDALLARTLINASGLSANLILNSLLPEASQIPMFYARGSYAAYSGPGISQISRLIYPCPDTGPNKHAFQSLGTHLTLDLQGKVRFGPDLEWISPPSDAEIYDYNEENVDFWRKHLTPSDSRLEEMYRAVTEYLPGVSFEGFRPDYVGVRPKVERFGFQDFVVRKDYADRSGRGLMVSLMGIESPGLTSSLAIAEHVVDDIIGPENISQ